MKYDSGFNFGMLFSERKYRARLILCVYLLFFVVLIFISRTSLSTSEVQDDELLENKDNEEKIETAENTDEQTEGKSGSILPGFEYISMNNYEFEYTLTLNDDIYIVNGKRFSDKLSFNVSNEDNLAEYISNGNIVKMKKEDEYINASLPFYYINYFDNNIVQCIISDSTIISNERREISNSLLSKYVDENFSYKESSNKTLTNAIDLSYKNGKIVEIVFDFTNLFSDVEELKILKIDLKYQNFGLIDDFEVKN